MADAVSGAFLPFVLSVFPENCCIVAACVLIYYDNICTFSRELQYMWGSPTNIAVALFHVNKWAISIWALVSISSAFMPLASYSSATCTTLNILWTALIVLLALLWAAFSGVRMYAISLGHVWLSSMVCALNLVPVGTNAWGFFSDTWYQMDGSPFTAALCNYGVSRSNALNARFNVTTRSCLIASDAIVIIMTWYITFITGGHRTRNAQTPITTALFRDGTAYFLALLVLNVLDIIGWCTNAFTDVAGFLTVPISSILMSHFLLNLHQMAHGQDAYGEHETSVASQDSGLRFAHIVGPMGGSLEICSDSSYSG
ncbi:hypothetical protein CERSUDRAFT_114848 [Gelatoporia subvermispora B]|uniref:DUF6533 domain-containing protein n=1 Tax=Ceriporiopsis subvermispora (strain B) TaxID=914234 RepID=M2RET1_CERS8|nr:hypothetical protein CERSUDRAFT_114848 [Gelatoporia subvermispora B]